ncbi:ATP synthase H chain mitochondrial precursor [Calycina marina]|uniref:ATP synthase H chain mitochondrial n=1 Tax=Calycina marina TaxID=1763456 RepID=A0A9P7Z9N3_9HELO|nr:ATP synthase H chain mitochondrial precursor [Calycina marina]
MFAQTIRASRYTIVRVARPQTITRRTFITPTALRQADLVQDLYLKELKAYKTPVVKASDSEGHVQKFSAPKTPESPEETDIANELKAYEAMTVETEGQAEGGAVADAGENWFEDPEVEEHDTKH